MTIFDQSSGCSEFKQTLYFEVEDIDATTPVNPYDYECPESDLFAVVVDC